MTLDFQKFHGNGNDFILFDNRKGNIRLSTDQIIHLCHRKYGIGSDGIILIEMDTEQDYYMNFYNPDGSQSFCGNGSRCALQFAHELGIIDREARFRAIDGNHIGKIDGHTMCIHMRNVDEVEFGEDYTYLNTGSPHYIKFVEDLENINVYQEGRDIRFNERCAREGTNVNFVQLEGNQIRSRVYERGVEDETYSSGTGTTAQALASYLQQPDLGENIEIETKGGNIQVSFKHLGGSQFTDIWLMGRVHQSFSGSIEL